MQIFRGAESVTRYKKNDAFNTHKNKLNERFFYRGIRKNQTKKN